MSGPVQRVATLFMLLVILSAQLGAIASQSTTLNLNYVSETLQPGQTANLQGGGFTATTQVQLQSIDVNGNPVGVPVSPVIVSRSANLIQIQIPASFSMGLWAVWLIDGSGNVSTTRYINQAAGLRFNTDSVAPGGQLEVWGRNLAGPGSGLGFVSPTNALYTAPANYADANHLVVNVPVNLTPGTAYQVYVSNGLGGNLGATLIKAPLTIRTGGADPLNLGVSWAPDLSYIPANPLAGPNTYNVLNDKRLAIHAYGDGVHDDAAAIQAAINLASKDSHGGGVVYLPAGTYLLDLAQTGTFCLSMKPNTVLIGDGPGKTTLRGGAPNVANLGVLSIYQANQAGIANLTLINQNTSGAANRTLYAGSASLDRFFVLNINCQMNNSSASSVTGTHVLISNSTISSTNTSNNIFYFSVPYIFLQNNTFNYFAGRMIMYGSDYALIRNNVYARNGAYSKPGTFESGAIDISSTAAPVVSNNQFSVLPAGQGGNNDGETVLTQDAANLRYFRDVGSLTAASGLVVTDNSKWWTTFTPFPSGEVVTITSGPALGQWRYVTGMTLNTITIDRPWDFVPPVGSGYALGGITADRVFALNNTFTNSIKPAIDFYDGAVHCTVSGNTSTNTGGGNLVDTGGILLSGLDQTYLPSDYRWPSIVAENVVWENQVFNNSCVNSGYKYVNISLLLRESHGPIHGMGIVMNNEVRNNLINQTFITLAGKVVSDPNSGYLTGGQTNISGYLPGSGAVLGTIFEGNTAVDLPDPYTLDPGTQQTVITLP